MLVYIQVWSNNESDCVNSTQETALYKIYFTRMSVFLFNGPTTIAIDIFYEYS